MSLLIGTLLICLGVQQLSYPLFVPATSGLVAIGTIRNARNIFEWNINFGKKEIWLPILMILLIIALNETTLANKLLAIFVIPTIYLLGINFGDKAFKYIHWLVIIGIFSIAVIVLNGGNWQEGGVFGQYNIAAMTLVLCTVVNKKKWLYPITISGLCLLGGIEGLIAIIGLLLILIYNKEWKIFGISLGIVSIIIPIGLLTGTTQIIFSKVETYYSGITSGDLQTALHLRFEPYKEAIENISLLGYGFSPFNNNGDSIHNVLLIVVNQIGVIGLIGWLWLYGWGLFKSKQKGVWFIIGIMSIFDNMMWAQLWLWYWYLLGSTQNLGKEDRK